MSDRARTFYRVAKQVPPGDDEFRSQETKFGAPRRHSRWTDDHEYGWGGLSMWDSEEGARRAAEEAAGRERPIGKKIVRFNFPVGVGIEWRQTFQRGHFTVKGDATTMKEFRDTDYEADI